MPIFQDAVPVAPAPNWSQAYLAPTLAQVYFDNRLGSDSWDNASDVDRGKALVQATRAIDRLRFAGVKTNVFNWVSGQLGNTFLINDPNLNDPAIPVQALEFPRNGLNSVPDEVLAACCEIALSLLDGVDVEQEMRGLNTTQIGFASVRETIDRTYAIEHLSAGIPSSIAWTYLKPFLADPYEISLSRTS